MRVIEVSFLWLTRLKLVDPRDLNPRHIVVYGIDALPSTG